MKKNNICSYLFIVFVLSFFFSSVVAQNRYKGKTTVRRTTSYSNKSTINRYIDYPYEGYNAASKEGKPVDLGLSVMWADRNVGAMSTSDDGALFAWGDVSDEYSRKRLDEYPQMTSIINTQYDAAHVKWGNGWRMPTKQEMIELFEKCKMSFVGIGEGHVAMKLTGPNGNSILLPLGGYVNPYGGGMREYRWRQGFYWVGETNVDETIWHMGMLNPVNKTFYQGKGEEKGVCMSYDWQVGLQGVDMKLHYISDKDKNWAFSVRPVRDGHAPQPIIERTSTQKSSTTQKGKGNNKGQGTRNSQSNTRRKPAYPGTISAPKSSAENNNNVESKSNKKDNTEKQERERKDWPEQEKVVFEYKDAVDLGLSVMWCSRNAGARTNVDAGLYVSWADPFFKSEKTGNNNDYLTSDIPNNIAETDYDMVKTYKKGKWRLPSKEECLELIRECKVELTTLNDKKGYKVTGKNGNWIFFPYAGYTLPKPTGTSHKEDAAFYVWTSETNTEKPHKAFILTGNEEKMTTNSISKFFMINLRGVCEK